LYYYAASNYIANRCGDLLGATLSIVCIPASFCVMNYPFRNNGYRISRGCSHCVEISDEVFPLS